MALQWVNQNIVAFGGDPNNVTLVGHGSGAVCACYHLISPRSAGLLHKLILMSGSLAGIPFSGWNHAKTPIEWSRMYAEAVGCKKTDTFDEMMSKLRAKS